MNKTVSMGYCYTRLKSDRFSFSVDLSAYYASFEAAPAVAPPTAVAAKAEPAPALDDDDDDDMEDVSVGPSKAASSSTAPARLAVITAADKDDEDDFEETVVPTASTTSAERDGAEGEVDPNTMVMGPYLLWSASDLALTQVSTVNGEAMPLSQVQDNEDLLDQMTPDEYSVGSSTSCRFLRLTSDLSRRISVC
jgi:hypothetical protein